MIFFSFTVNECLDISHADVMTSVWMSTLIEIRETESCKKYCLSSVLSTHSVLVWRCFGIVHAVWLDLTSTMLNATSIGINSPCVLIYNLVSSVSLHPDITAPLYMLVYNLRGDLKTLIRAVRSMLVCKYKVQSWGRTMWLFRAETNY